MVCGVEEEKYNEDKGDIVLAAAVVIGFCGGIRVDEVFLTSLKRMMKFLEETRKKKNSCTPW